MKKDQVQIGGTFVAKVSGKLAKVRIDAESRFGGWDATNVDTGRKVRIKSAQRLRREVATSTNTETSAADLPPQDIDERIAAAPPSIVPYEERRARAERGQAAAAEPNGATEAAEDDAPRYDPTRCATKRCRGTPVLTYLERPMCQACWERHCREEQPSEVSESAGDACHPTEEQETPEQENAMSKKKSTKNQTSKKQTKAQPAAAKAKRVKKAAATKARATTESKPKRVSALDAAATVLAKAGKPMRAQELIAAMTEKGLWTSPGGKTPHATLYAAMMREARDKKADSRFRKTDRGQFAFNG
jgi:Mg-chelatase subunit ChlI